MAILRYTVPGPPVTTNQGYKPASWGKRQGMVLTDAGAAYKARLLLYARKAWMLAGRPEALKKARVAIRFSFKTLGSDIDGAVKFVLDSLAPAGIIVNDNRVRRLEVDKLDPDGVERTEVDVEGI